MFWGKQSNLSFKKKELRVIINPSTSVTSDFFWNVEYLFWVNFIKYYTVFGV